MLTSLMFPWKKRHPQRNEPGGWRDNKGAEQADRRAQGMSITEKYSDIIHLPHPVSEKHPRMPMQDRAAQFPPFAALTGYEEAIYETGRLTE